MKRFNFVGLASSGAIALAALVGVPQPAQAIVINHIAGAATAIALGGGFPAVTEIFLGGSACSGALISPTTVITAQHCTFGVAPGAVTVNFHHINNDGVPDASVGVSAITQFDATNVLLDGSDVAILTLAAAAPAAITPLQFLAANPLGVTASTVGFGWNGTGDVGHGGTADGLKWAAQNVIDFYGAAQNPGGVNIGGTANIFNTDFDNPTGTTNTLAPGKPSSAVMLANEGTTAPGDSGGPLLVNGLIVGVLSGGTLATSAYGDISWWTGTLQWQTQIQNLGGVFVTDQQPPQVPVPSTLALILLGIAWLGIARRWRPMR